MFRRLLRGLSVLFLLLVAILVGGIVAFWTPDIDRATLEKYYAGPDSAFVMTASGARIHYRDQGLREGSAIVLIHGTGASLHSWESWAHLLGENYRIITLDLPAHGLTGATPDGDYGRSGMIAAIEAVVSATGLDRFVIGGNSMGGEMALAYALAHPGRVRGLVLVDSAGLGRTALPANGSSSRSVPIAFRIARMTALRWLVTKVTPRALIEEGLRSVYADDSRIDDLAIDRYWHLLRLEGSRAAMMARFAESSRETDPLPVERLTMPAFVLWGEQDRLIPPDYGRALAARLPDASFISYADAGHVPMEEIPERSVADVRRFLAMLRDREVQTKVVSVEN